MTAAQSEAAARMRYALRQLAEAYRDFTRAGPCNAESLHVTFVPLEVQELQMTLTSIGIYVTSNGFELTGSDDSAEAFASTADGINQFLSAWGF